MTSINGFNIDCKFGYHQSYWGSEYACVTEPFETNEKNRTITKVTGQHEDGKTNDDVELFLVNKAKCPYLPLDVAKFFKNLKTFYVMKSGVTKLTNDDLKGFGKLQIFDVSYNPIERLEKGFFNGKSAIKVISFYDCALQYVDSEALDPLVNLHEGHFQLNHCVDYRGDAKHLVPILKKHLKNCDGTKKVDMHPVDESSGELSFFDEENSEDEIDEDEIKMVEEKMYQEFLKFHTSSSENPNNQVHQIHYIEREMTFVRRNAYWITSMLCSVILVMSALMFIQIKKSTIDPRSLRLSEDF